MAGNILIVDDAAPTLKLLTDMLVSAGYQARPFSNGELALRSVSAQPPDLVLLDVRMPGMDGIELCRRLKLDERLLGIPVIFISGAVHTEDKLRAFAAGGVDYITKPFQREEVLARVHTQVALHRSQRQLMEADLALRKSEQRLRVAQSVAHLGHWELDMQSGAMQWSEETYRVLGMDPNSAGSSLESFLNAVHPDDRQHVASRLAEARHGGELDMDFRIVLPDGRLRVVHGKGVLMSFADDDRRPELMGTVQWVKEMIGVVQDITERKEMEWRLEHEARTDALTGCATRRHFMEQANMELARVRRYGGKLSMLMLDLDHFKRVNDSHGHHVGDLTLQKLAQVCHEVLRQGDIAGRLGGEEFGVLLVETDKASAMEAAERLRLAIAAAEVPLEDGGCVRFTASIGVATAEPGDGNIEAVFKRADHALYEAKNNGRNRVAAA